MVTSYMASLRTLEPSIVGLQRVRWFWNLNDMLPVLCPSFPPLTRSDTDPLAVAIVPSDSAAKSTRLTAEVMKSVAASTDCPVTSPSACRPSAVVITDDPFWTEPQYDVSSRRVAFVCLTSSSAVSMLTAAASCNVLPVRRISHMVPTSSRSSCKSESSLTISCMVSHIVVISLFLSAALLLAALVCRSRIMARISVIVPRLIVRQRAPAILLVR